MKILLTGSTGFVGTSILKADSINEYLSIGRSSTSFLNGKVNVKHVNADLNDIHSWKKSVADFLPDCCINLAWNGIPDYSLQACEYNLAMHLRFIRELSDLGVGKFIMSGSCWEYGNKTNGLTDELAEPENPNLFGLTKRCLNQLLDKHLENQDLPKVIWPRIFFSYGPGQRLASLIPSLYYSIKNDKPLSIMHPEVMNDFIFISDVANAILHLATQQVEQKAYNIGSGYPTSVAYIANQVLIKMGKDKQYPDNLECPSSGLIADISSICDATNWAPKIDIDSGISITIDSLESSSPND